MRAYVEHTEEVVADLRQYYLYDLPLDPDEAEDISLPAALWRQLPRESRSARRIDPDCLWGPSEYLLREIEHAVRHLAWMWSEDGAKGRNAPEKIRSPGDVAAARDRADAALAAREEIDRALGITSE